MGAVTANFSMSLDGFVADPDGGVGPLFDWYANGPLFGEGIRFFDGLDGRTVLEDPEIVAGTRVTHLRYRVRH